MDIDTANVKVSLTTGSNEVLKVEDPLRYLRWRTDDVQAQAQFLSDVIAR